MVILFWDGKERWDRNVVKGGFSEQGCGWGDGSEFLGQDVGRIKGMFAKNEVRCATQLQDLIQFTYEMQKLLLSGGL